MRKKNITRSPGIIISEKAKSYEASTDYMVNNLDFTRLDLIKEDETPIQSKRAWFMQGMKAILSVLTKISLLWKYDSITVIGSYTAMFMIFLNRLHIVHPGKLYWWGFFIHSRRVQRVLKVYFKLFYSKNVQFIVFSKNEQELYRERLGLPKEAFVYIPYGDWKDEGLLSGRKPLKECGYFFSGGYSNRDYKTLIKAWELSSEKLVIAGSRNNLDLMEYLSGPHDRQNANIEVFLDISPDKFDSLLKGATACILPFKDDTGASGQTVALKSMRFGKPVICSRIKAMEEYIDEGVSGEILDNMELQLAKIAYVLCRRTDILEKMVKEQDRIFLERFSYSAVTKALRQTFVKEGFSQNTEGDSCTEPNLMAGQFSILKEETGFQGCLSAVLGNGMILNWHESVPVFRDNEKDVTLIGRAWQVMPGKNAPQEEIGSLDLSGDFSRDKAVIEEMESTWDGRYVLLYKDYVFMDASGLFGVFYSRDGLASSCQVLAHAQEVPLKTYAPSQVMNWFPGPDTHYPDIKRLLPSQVYCIGTGELVPRQLMCNVPLENIQGNTLIEKFTGLYIHSMKNMGNLSKGKGLLLALTGGHDSRVLFAMMKKADINFSCFTAWHEGICQDDIILPEKICSIGKIPYYFIKRDEEAYSPWKEKLYREFDGGIVRDEDRLFYAYGQYDKVKEMCGGDIVVVRGGMWETATDFFGADFNGEIPSEGFFGHYEINPGSQEAGSISSYLLWCAKSPQENLPMPYRFYWEQRGGCWLSTIEQGFGLMNGIESVQPMNSRILLSMLFLFDRKEREGKSYQEAVTNFVMPELAGIPYAKDNGMDMAVPGRIFSKAVKMARKIKTVGIIETLKFVSEKIKRKIKQETRKRE